MKRFVGYGGMFSFVPVLGSFRTFEKVEALKDLFPVVPHLLPFSNTTLCAHPGMVNSKV